MKIHLLSDLHLEYADFTPCVPAADLIVLAGDVGVGTAGVEWARRHYPEHPVLYVPGNHEFYGGEVSEVLAAMRQAAEGSRVTILDRELAVVDGIRFLGLTLWTDFRLFAGDDPLEHMWAQVDARRGIPDFDGRIRVREGASDTGLSPEISGRWHGIERQWLASELVRPFAGKTVVVSHHAPSLRSIPAMYAADLLTPAYASALDPFMAHCDLWLHGHTHAPVDYVAGRCRVVCNPRGYDGESAGFDAELVITL